MQDNLRDKVADQIRLAASEDWDLYIPGDSAILLADRILAIPEIAEALEAFDDSDDAPIYLSPEQRVALQHERNKQARAMLDRIGAPFDPNSPPSPVPQPK
jgi:hypothetical protein